MRRSVHVLSLLNQTRGFDCPGCAWPDPGDRGTIEFCENGAKAVAHEATVARLDADFAKRHALTRLAAKSDYWLERQGRLTEPLWKPRGADHYQPVSWDDANARIAGALRDLPSPDQAIFYTSGRTSNEAAFLYQLLARLFGTNNLPDCSNMCHESSGTGLTEVIGVSKGTVGLGDFERAGAIFVIGQNPGTNHPRMLTALLAARRQGCRIVSINPLKERGLVRFAHPQDARSMLRGGEPISDLYLQVRVGGDIALLKGIMREVLAAEARAPGRVCDWRFIRDHTEGLDALRRDLEGHSWSDLERESGVERADMRRAANIYIEADGVIACWAMGLTQQRHGVANVQEIINLLLLRGNIGRPGAGPCPVRGHSNVQGDRTMGITEKPRAEFLARLGEEFGFSPPPAPGFDTVDAIRAMRDGRARVFIGMGGNFAAATPDAEVTAEALRRCTLTVQVSTKLNRSHLVCGEEAIILPCLGRTEIDRQASGEQFVTVEDSMSVVHRSQGSLAPASEHLRSEPAIVAGLATALDPNLGGVPWRKLVANYDRIRDHIEGVIPGFEDYNRRVRRASGFVLPSAARMRAFETPGGKALFSCHPLPESRLAPGRLRMTTIRSHDQFNTTIYGFDDRYRGIRGDRRVIFVNASDAGEQGVADGDEVDVTSHFDGERRVLTKIRVVIYDVPKGCAAMYYPEANPLVALGSMAEKSQTPAYKNVEISVSPSGTSRSGSPSPS